MSQQLRELLEACSLDKEKTTPHKPLPQPQQLTYANAEDITEFLKQATSEMELGALIHKPGFHLAEAMSCLEIMDPKMDNGMQLQITPIFTAAEANEIGLLPKDSTLTIQELILLFDQLFQAEVGFYQGESLLQTVFTCLYLHDLSNLTNPYLQVFARLVLKTCSIIKDLVLSTDIYEEEDFSGALFGFHLLESLKKEEVIKMVTTAEEDLERKIKRAKLGTQSTSDEQEMLQKDPEREIEFCEALLARLRFKRGFYTSQMHFEKGAKGLEAAKKSLVYAQHQLPLILASHAKYASESTLPSGIFEPGITRRLFATALPNTIQLPSFDESVTFIQNYLGDCLYFYGLPAICGDLPTFLKVIHKFSQQDKNVLSRARLFRLVFSNDKIFGSYEMSEMVMQDMKQYGINPIELTLPVCKGLADHLSHNLIILCHNLFFNRSRLRCKLTLGFEDWGSLQEHAEMLDLKLHQDIAGDDGPPPSEPVRLMFSNYVIEHTLSLMIAYVKLGFELELFSHFEYSLAFWYFDFLFGRWSSVKASNMQFSFNQRIKQVHLANKLAKSANNRKGKKGKVKRVKNIDPPSPTYEHIVIEANQSLSRALVRYIAAINRREGIPDTKEFPFGSNSLRFMQRFKAFHRLRAPPALSYEHYVESMKTKDTHDAILTHASEMLDVCKLCLDRALKLTTDTEEIAELKKLTRVALSNKINIMRLSPTAHRIVYNFDTHPIYPIITVE